MMTNIFDQHKTQGGKNSRKIPQNISGGRDFEFIRKEFEVTYKTYNSVDTLIDASLHYFATRDEQESSAIHGKF